MAYGVPFDSRAEIGVFGREGFRSGGAAHTRRFVCQLGRVRAMSKAIEIVMRARALPVREARPASRLLSTLRENGWHRSVRSHASVGVDAHPLPWWTYSATRWLELA